MGKERRNTGDFSPDGHCSCPSTGATALRSAARSSGSDEVQREKYGQVVGRCRRVQAGTSKWAVQLREARGLALRMGAVGGGGDQWERVQLATKIREIRRMRAGAELQPGPVLS